MALSGKKPIVIDGHTRAPELQLLLAADATRGAKVPTTPQALCEQQNRAARLITGPPTRVGRGRDLEVDDAVDKLRTRQYEPKRGKDRRREFFGLGRAPRHPRPRAAADVPDARARSVARGAPTSQRPADIWTHARLPETKIK